VKSWRTYFNKYLKEDRKYKLLDGKSDFSKIIIEFLQKNAENSEEINKIIDKVVSKDVSSLSSEVTVLYEYDEKEKFAADFIYIVALYKKHNKEYGRYRLALVKNRNSEIISNFKETVDNFLISDLQYAWNESTEADLAHYWIIKDLAEKSINPEKIIDSGFLNESDIKNVNQDTKTGLYSYTRIINGKEQKVYPIGNFPKKLRSDSNSTNQK